MNRRILLIGIVLGVVAVFAEIVVQQQIVNSLQQPNTSSTSVALTPNGVVDAAVPINSLDVVEIAYNSTSPATFYLLNASAFGYVAAGSRANQSVGNAILGLGGRGVYYIMDNGTSGIMLYNTNATYAYPKPEYAVSNRTRFANGTYYAIFQNSANRTAELSYTVYIKSIANVGQAVSAVGPYGMISAIAVFAAVALVAASFLMKGGDKKKEVATTEDVEKLYADINKKQNETRSSKPKAPKKKAGLPHGYKRVKRKR